MPPRCNPFTILLLVLSIGMLFIGVTMTLIANWPGATSIGDNPLRIAGPVLLGVGGALFIFGVILVCLLNVQEREKWDRNLGMMVAARLNSTQTDQGPLISDDGMGSKPNRSILKTSTGEDSSYGYNLPPYGPRVEALPDPAKSSQAPNGRSGSVGSGEGYDQNNIPTPLRVTKKRRPHPKGDISGSSSGTNQSLTVSIGEADLGLPGMTSSQRASGISGQQIYANMSFEGDNAAAGTGKPQGPGVVKDGRQQRAPGAAGYGRNARPPVVDPIRDPVMRNVAIQQQQLRVHIKAQPGTAVHITPTPTPPRGAAQYGAGHPSSRYPRTSAADSETEI
jgi:hypothetical protein